MGKKCTITTCIVGGLLVVAGIVLLAGDYPTKFINSEIDNQLVLSLDSPVFDDWMTPPPPIYMQYWLFNVTNPAEVIKGKKANLTQVGPYTYRLYQPRFGVAFFTNDTVAYQYNHTLVFQPDKSGSLREDDLITNLNVPLVTVGRMLKNLPESLQKVVQDVIWVLGDSDLFPEHTVKELLFGYSDNLLTLAHDAFSLIGQDFPGQFGIFYGFNNTDDGIYLTNTGRSNISLTNKIERWNHEESLDYWNTPYGNMLNGTDGVFYYPGLKTTDTIYAFSTDICRSLPFSFDVDTEVEGLTTMRFHTTKKAFGNVSVNPDNAAFCIPPGNCLNSGVLNISVCKQNAPVIISSPHFYQGADEYIHGVNGLNPNVEHETHLDIEPTTGTVLSANKRLQINIYLEKSEFSTQMSDVRTTIFPFVWLNESVYVDDDSANKLKEVFMLQKFVLSIPFILFGLAALLFIIVLGLYCCRRHKNKFSVLVNVSDTPITDETDS